MNILQRIIKDNFGKIIETGLKIRGVVYENVNRTINCGDFNLGFAEFKCNCCGKTKRVPFRCKSRFCTSCGNLYNIKRATTMKLKLLKCRHRHCVFTIPEELRPFFSKTEQRSIVSSPLFGKPSFICSTK